MILLLMSILIAICTTGIMTVLYLKLVAEGMLLALEMLKEMLGPYVDED